MIYTPTDADFPRLAEIWEGAVRATHDFLSEADIAFFRRLVPTYFPQVTMWALREDGVTAGFVGVAENKVEMLFVDPALRGTGVGKRLLQHALAHGANEVDVNEQNPQAVGFYQKMGFEVTGRSPLDGMGKPFPLLHMRLAGAQAAARGAGS